MCVWSQKVYIFLYFIICPISLKPHSLIVTCLFSCQHWNPLSRTYIKSKRKIACNYFTVFLHHLFGWNVTLMENHEMSFLICRPTQVSSDSPVPTPDASSPVEEAIVWTLWTLRTTLEAGALTWTWSSSTSTQSTGSSASSYSASSATSSSLLSDAAGNSDIRKREGRVRTLQDEGKVRLKDKYICSMCICTLCVCIDSKQAGWSGGGKTTVYQLVVSH